MIFLGYINKKEATGASIFGDKNERIFGGDIGWGVIKDENGVKAIKAELYEELLKEHRAKNKKPKEATQPNLEFTQKEF